MDATDKKRYNQMENVLIKINQKYISLPDVEIKRNNKILEQVTEKITTLMKEKDVLFKSMYEKKYYGGSYYDGIKVGKPEEYDLDYVLNLPVIIEPTLQSSDKPGFVNIYIKEYMKLLKRDEAPKFEKLDTLMDSSSYLSTFKVLQWMERTLNLALNEFKKDSNGSFCFVDMGNDKKIKVYATVSKAHPAFTLKLKDKEKTFNFDVDLVPCFQFTKEKWPQGNYRPNPFPLKEKFLVVPKKPHGMEDTEGTNIERYWRLSFQEQERELIKGKGFRNMKPAIKLLKKLRDKHNHIIASYYIKTIFLWEATKQSEDFWKQPLSCVFMLMLKKYAEIIKNKNIPYFWNENFNLIDHLKDVTMTDIGNKLKNIIDDVERNLENPFVIAKYLVNQEQVDQLMEEVDLGRKHQKNLKIANCVKLDTPLKSDVICSTPTEDEKIKKLVSDKEFLQEVAKQIAQYLEPKLNYNSQTSSHESFSYSNSVEKTNEIMMSLNGLHKKNNRLVDMITGLQSDNQQLIMKCSNLTDRVCSLENNVADLSLENSKLRSQESSHKKPFAEVLEIPFRACSLENNVADLSLENSKLRSQESSHKKPSPAVLEIPFPYFDIPPFRDDE